MRARTRARVCVFVIVLGALALPRKALALMLKLSQVPCPHHLSNIYSLSTYYVPGLLMHSGNMDEIFLSTGVS